MDLHSQIINLQPSPDRDGIHLHPIYKDGHRDARHAAAELALKTDALLHEIKSIADDAADRGDVLGQRIARLFGAA